MFSFKKRHSTGTTAPQQQQQQPPISPRHPANSNPPPTPNCSRSEVVTVNGVYNFYYAWPLPPSPYVPPPYGAADNRNRSPDYRGGYDYYGYHSQRLQRALGEYAQLASEHPIPRLIAEAPSSTRSDVSSRYTASSNSEHTRASTAGGRDVDTRGRDVDTRGREHGYGYAHAPHARESQAQLESQIRSRAQIQALGPCYADPTRQSRTEVPQRSAGQHQAQGRDTHQGRRASDAHSSRTHNRSQSQSHSQSHTQWAPSPSQHQHQHARANHRDAGAPQASGSLPPLAYVPECRERERAPDGHRLKERRSHGRARAQSFSPASGHGVRFDVREERGRTRR
ncbi:hypothetical protein DENSPDRAFT_507964 [Dentipellis sp. KUC8613]|nr:hypothetical protein DENSPDRAFT_507964 [Dentipellis sp. KUC8613]